MGFGWINCRVVSLIWFLVDLFFFVFCFFVLVFGGVFVLFRGGVKRRGVCKYVYVKICFCFFGIKEKVLWVFGVWGFGF